MPPAPESPCRRRCNYAPSQPWASPGLALRAGSVLVNHCVWGQHLGAAPAPSTSEQGPQQRKVPSVTEASCLNWGTHSKSAHLLCPPPTLGFPVLLVAEPEQCQPAAKNAAGVSFTEPGRKGNPEGVSRASPVPKETVALGGGCGCGCGRPWLGCSLGSARR